MVYNNHGYGTKSIYHQHMECLNTSWIKTIMSTAARVCLSSTHGMLKYLMANNNYEYGISIVNTWNA